MPIPLLFIALGVGSGLVGVGKGIKAGIDQSDANDTNTRAKHKIDYAVERADRSRKNSGKELKDLGERKVEILNTSIKDFITSFEKINNIELSESKGLNEINNIKIDKKEFNELKNQYSMAKSLAGGATTGAMAGAMTAFGAYGAAGTLATASTGTAISTLSGAAATNATLAFFGGGSLASGGLGIAGGTAVLGGLVAGPAIAIFGLVAGAKASKNLDIAYENLAKAKSTEEDMKAIVDSCNAIRRRAAMYNRTLLKLQAIFDPLVYKLEEIIQNSGTNYEKYTSEEKQYIAASLSMAGAVKSILDTPILDKDGNLTEQSEKILDDANVQLSKGKIALN